ncbi:MAG: hypothetical protein Q4A12_04550 [Eubacteriales bacterium]|nr:hypothetical protein [Eubacteriales bacterium]
MLTIKSVENESIIKKCGVDNATILLSEEDGIEKGYIAFTQTGYVIDIVGFEVYYSEEELKGEAYTVADALIKSLGSYALNHSCFYIECSRKELFSLLKNFDFAQNDNSLTINLQQLFKVCKN